MRDTIFIYLLTTFLFLIDLSRCNWRCERFPHALNLVIARKLCNFLRFFIMIAFDLHYVDYCPS